MDIEDIKTDTDYLDALLEQLDHADDIYVRAQVDGKWGSHALTEIPSDQAVGYIRGWIKDRRVPVRIVRDEKKV